MAITNRDRRFYRLALRVADDSECDSRHGVVIVIASRVMAIATNRKVTHPISDAAKKATIHAEQRALIRLGARRARGATLYSARSHAHTLSLPCTMCAHLAKEAGVRRIVWNNGNDLEDSLL